MKNLFIIYRVGTDNKPQTLKVVEQLFLVFDKYEKRKEQEVT